MNKCFLANKHRKKNIFSWKIGSSNSFTQQGLNCPDADFEGNKDGQYILHDKNYYAYLESPIGDSSSTCMSFNFASKNGNQIRVKSKNASSGFQTNWQLNDVSSEWTVGQVKVSGYQVRINVYANYDGWIAIDNIRFTNSEDCKTLPQKGILLEYVS